MTSGSVVEVGDGGQDKERHMQEQQDEQMVKGRRVQQLGVGSQSNEEGQAQENGVGPLLSRPQGLHHQR